MRILKNNKKLILGILIGLILPVITVYATSEMLFASSQTSFDNTIAGLKNLHGDDVETVEEAIEALANGGCQRGYIKQNETSSRYECEIQLPPGNETVRDAILAKQNAATNSCNPIWVDDNGTQDESDDITYFAARYSCVDMNYVWYSGKLWRITKIYPDGAMQLITENAMTSIAYNEVNTPDFYTNNNTTSYVYQWLNEDFYNTLYNPDKFIDKTKKFNITNSSASDLSEISTRLSNITLITANVGLLNSYEYFNSYRCADDANCSGSNPSKGFLNNKYYWWLLNPFDSTSLWLVGTAGNVSCFAPDGTRSLRPVINIKSNLKFTGSGTVSDPYKIVGDKTVGNANDLVNTRLSGEYVKLKNGNNERLFRIIGVEDNKTKIIAMDYAENKNTRQFATSEGSANTLWGSGTTAGTDTWYTYLNASTTGYLDTLKSTYGELFDSGLYYLGTSGDDFKLSVCANTTSGSTKVCTKTSNVGTFNIGLPRYGEMFATQQTTGYSNSIGMWLMNRYSETRNWYIYNTNAGSGATPNQAYAARPTVHLKSTVKILSGSGTEYDPYVVGL